MTVNLYCHSCYFPDPAFHFQSQVSDLRQGELLFPSVGAGFDYVQPDKGFIKLCGVGAVFLTEAKEKTVSRRILNAVFVWFLGAGSAKIN